MQFNTQFFLPLQEETTNRISQRMYISFTFSQSNDIDFKGMICILRIFPHFSKFFSFALLLFMKTAGTYGWHGNCWVKLNFTCSRKILSILGQSIQLISGTNLELVMKNAWWYCQKSSALHPHYILPLKTDTYSLVTTYRLARPQPQNKDLNLRTLCCLLFYNSY